MAVQPAHAGAVGRIERNVEHETAGAQPVFDVGREAIEPLPGKRRRQHRPVFTAPLGDVLELKACLGIQRVDLVPDLDQPLVIVRIDVERAQDLFYVMRLRGRVLMRRVAHMKDHVGLDDLFECRPE